MSWTHSITQGVKIEEQLTHENATNDVLTFSEPVKAIEIYHEEATWQEFVVNGITINVPSGGWSRPIGGTASADVTIPTGVSCIVGRLV